MGEVVGKPAKSFAIIGTREPDAHQAEIARLLAFVITCVGGHIVKTGAAYGIDQKAMEGSGGKNLEVYLPWDSYNRDIVPASASVVVYNPAIHIDWTDSVSKFHPNIFRLGRGARALHARNYGIVHGCTAVIALPREDGGGGTAQGVRIAQSLNIPVIQWNKGSIEDMPRTLGRILQQLGLANPNLKPTYRSSEFESE